MTPTTEQVKIVRTNMAMFYIQKKYKIYPNVKTVLQSDKYKDVQENSYDFVTP